MAKRKCIFCVIADQQDPKTELLYNSPEDETNGVIVFRDHKPAAKHHYLVCPQEHIKDCKALGNKHIPLVEKMVEVGRQVLSEQGGDVGDVSVGFHWPPFTLISHLHLHVISPPGDAGFVARQIFRPNSWWFVSPEYVIGRLKSMPAEVSKH